VAKYHTNQRYYQDPGDRGQIMVQGEPEYEECREVDTQHPLQQPVSALPLSVIEKVSPRQVVN
jgi:hypothetical protein